MMKATAKLRVILGVLILVSLFAVPEAKAADVNLVYINGIQNTIEDHTKTLNMIIEVVDASNNHNGSKRLTFSVSGAYNPIGWHDNKDEWGDLIQDKMEVFLLKAAEELYSDDFKKIMVPFNMSQAIDEAGIEAASRVTAYLTNMTPGNTSLESEGKITDTDMILTQGAATKLYSKIKTLGSAVVVAHSQGNLLANLAYARLVREYGNNALRMVRIVNVANTSQFSANSLNFTHEDDHVLFGDNSSSLQFMPSRENWTRESRGTSEFTLAPATFSAPTVTINYPNNTDGAVDSFLHHSIQLTYLSEFQTTVPVLIDQGVNFTPSKERFVDRFEDFVYAAAESLRYAADATGKIPDTGQTQSYTNTPGEDSDYNINPQSYTKLDAGGNDLPDNAGVWAIVRDNVTGLIWENKTADNSIHDYRKAFTWYDPNPATNGGNAGTPGNGTDTKDFIDALNAANFGGYHDWRLPTVMELSMIVNAGRYNPSINTTYFQNTMSSYYWSSTTLASSSGGAWLVHFYGGYVSYDYKSYNLYVRAVRGGQ